MKKSFAGAPASVPLTGSAGAELLFRSGDGVLLAEGFGDDAVVELPAHGAWYGDVVVGRLRDACTMRMRAANDSLSAASSPP